MERGKKTAIKKSVLKNKSNNSKSKILNINSFLAYLLAIQFDSLKKRKKETKKKNTHFG